MFRPTFRCGTITIGSVVGLAILATIVAGVAVWHWASRRVPPEVRVISTGPVTLHIEKLSELVTLRVQIADVLTGEGPGMSGAWLIKGDGLIGVDLQKAKIMSRDEATKKIVYQLAPPHVIQSRVDHEKTKTWEVKKTTWIPWRIGDQDALRDQVMQEAQRLVESSTASDENMKAARSHAELLIQDYCMALGWTAEINWEK